MGDGEFKLSILGGGCYQRGIDTTFSEAGHHGCARLSIGGMNLREGILGEFMVTGGTGDGKFVPTGDDGTEREGTVVTNTRTTVSIGAAHATRDLFPGTSTTNLFSLSSGHLGVGKLTSQKDQHDNNGTLETYPEESTWVVEAVRQQLFGLEFKPGADWSIIPYVGLKTTTLLTDDTPRYFGTMDIALLIGCMVGWTGSSAGTDTTTTLAKYLYALYSLYGLRALEIAFQQIRLQGPAGAISDLFSAVNGEPTKGVSGGSTTDIAPLQMFAAFSSANYEKYSVFARVQPADAWMRWTLLGAEVAGAIGCVAAAGEPETGDAGLYATGFVAAIQAAGMGMLAGGLENQWLWLYHKLVGLGLEGLAIALNGEAPILSHGLAAAGVQASLLADRNPDPRDEGWIDGTTYRYDPFTLLWYNDALHYRSAIEIEKGTKTTLLGGNISTGVTLASPLLYLDNAGTRVVNELRADEEVPPEEGAPSTLISMTNLNWTSDPNGDVWVRGGLGAEVATQFVGNDTHVGIGGGAHVEVGFNLTRDNRWALTLGAKGRGIVTDNGNEGEVAFRIGLLTRPL